MSARRILLGTTALVLFASSALAADNATLITPCAAGCVTVRSIDTTGSGGPMVPVVALGSTTGAAIATIAGTPNTTSVLSVQGTTGGTTLPVTAAQATAGNLNATVVGTGTFAVQATGTVTANAGTNLNTSLLALEAGGNLAAIKPGTDRLISSATNIVAGSALATTSFIIGTRYLSTPPTFTNGQEGAFQIDAAGRMLVTANATLGAETTKVIGTVRNLGNGGGVLDAVVGATYPANALAVGVLNGSNIGRLVGDETSGLWVNIKAGAGSGGTALADAATFTLTTTSMTPAGCTFNSGSLTLTTGTAGALSCTAGRSLHTTVDTVTNWAGGALGAMANYGTSPGAVLVPGVNAFVTNATALGQVAMAASSPVVLANNQTVPDACMFAAKTNISISTTSGTTQLVAPSGSTQVYVCSIVTVGATASVQNLVGGTGATCTTGTPAAIIGSTTAANGMSFAANGGFAYGNGEGVVASTTTAGHGLCLIQSGTAQISGNAMIVQK